MLASTFIDQALDELGEATDGTGYWTRAEVLVALQEICDDTAVYAKHLSGVSVMPQVKDQQEYTLPSDFLSFRKQGLLFDNKELEIWDLQRITNYDYKWKTTTGDPAVIIREGYGQNTFAAYPIPDTDADFVVNNKALTSNVATLTTASAHGFAVGDSITVYDVDSTFNGTYTTITGTTGTTIVYALTASNVTSVASTGFAQLATIFDGDFVLFYVKKPATLVEASTIELPEGYWRGMKAGAKSALMDKDREGKSFARAADLYKIYMIAREAIKTAFVEKDTPTTRKILKRPGPTSGLTLRTGFVTVP